MSVVASFTYNAFDGTPVARIDRIAPGRNGKSKEFLPHLATTSGFSETPGLNGAILPLYHLDELLASRAGAVFVVEGEGKCDALRDALKIAGSLAVATTIAGGASAPLRPEHVAAFNHMKTVFVLPDADDPGRAAAQTRAQRIADANPAVDVRICEIFPDKTDGLDIADWLLQGRTIAELRKLASKSSRIVAREAIAPTRDSTSALSFEDLVAKCSEVVDWQIDGLLRRSGVLLLAAQPKAGKSELARNLAKSVATGGTFLGRQCRQGRVLFIELEEGAAYLAEHLHLMRMAGLPISYVVERPIGDESAWLRAMIERHRPTLCIIDTIGRFSNIENICDYSQVKRATQPLLDLRTEFGVTFVVLHHSNRGNGVLGSTMWNGTADTILTLTRSEDQTRFAEADGRGILMERTALTFDRETGEITAAEPAYVTERRIAEKRVLAILEKTKTASREELARQCGRKASVGRSAVDALVAAGLLRSTGDGTRSNPRLYALADEANTSGRERVHYMDEDPDVPDPSSDELPDARRGNPSNPDLPDVPDESEGGESLLGYARVAGL